MIIGVLTVLSSCATIFNGSRAKIVFDANKIDKPVNLTVDGKSILM